MRGKTQRIYSRGEKDQRNFFIFWWQLRNFNCKNVNMWKLLDVKLPPKVSWSLVYQSHTDITALEAQGCSNTFAICYWKLKTLKLLDSWSLVPKSHAFQQLWLEDAQTLWWWWGYANTDTTNNWEIHCWANIDSTYYCYLLCARSMYWD